MRDKIISLLRDGRMSIDDLEKKCGDVKSELLELIDDGIIDKSMDYGVAHYSIRESKIDFTYNDGKRYENERYSIDFPDSFVKVDKEGREFVYYLPNGEMLDYDEGGAKIIIYSSSYFNIPDNSLNRMTLDVGTSLYEYTFWTAGYKMFMEYGGKPLFKIVELDMGMVCMITMSFDTQDNFYFVCPLKGDYKQIRVVIEGNEPTYLKEDMAINLMNKFRLNEKEICEIKLNNKKYFNHKLDKKEIEEISNDIKDADKNVRVYFNLNVKSEVVKNKNLNDDGIFNRLKNTTRLFDRYLKQAYELVLSIRDYNSKTSLVPIYFYLNEFIKNSGEFTINSKDGRETLSSELASNIYFKIFSKDILKLIEDFDKEEVQEVVEEIKIDKSFLKESRREFLRLKRDWSSFKEEYKDALNSKTIFSEYALKVEMMNLKKTARSFGDKFEDIIIDVDKKAKVLVEGGANYNFIGEVIEYIDEVYSAFEDLKLDFNASTEYNNLDLGSYSYEVSEDVIKIRYYWKEEYDHHPEVLKYKNKEAEKNRNFGKGKDIINNFIYSLSDNVISEDEWKEEVKKIDDLREEFMDKSIGLVHEKYDGLKKKLKEEHTLKVGDINEELSRIEDINMSNEEELAGLSSVKFMKKERLKSAIEANKKRIINFEDEMNKNNRQYQDDLKDLDEKEKKEVEEVSDEVYKKYIYPENPNKLIEEVRNILIQCDMRSVSMADAENNILMDLVCEELSYLARPLTIPEMISLSDELSKYSNHKLSSLLNDLVRQGRVVKKVDGKRSYFSLNDGDYNTYEDEKIVLDYPFAIDMKRVLDVLKKGRCSFDEIDFSLGDISKFRIMQVIKSLYDCEKVDISVRNDILISLK